jgi:hypothetical protein
MMKSKEGMPIYEPPLARDLSGGSIRGKVPLAYCHFGSEPGACSGGDGPGGSCRGGGSFGKGTCGGGSWVTAATCEGGSIPGEGLLEGLLCLVGDSG